jgi:hypothetical protein
MKNQFLGVSADRTKFCSLCGGGDGKPSSGGGVDYTEFCNLAGGGDGAP